LRAMSSFSDITFGINPAPFGGLSALLLLISP
jgi:hypothetical protein